MERAETTGYIRRQPKKESFQKFLWNSEKKEFCGRTGDSWGECLKALVLHYQDYNIYIIRF